jgi:hypothetical protein
MPYIFTSGRGREIQIKEFSERARRRILMLLRGTFAVV